MSEFIAVIGLEVHVQLSTQSKMFTTSSTETGLPPNSLTDVGTLGLPGSLPVLNKVAVDYAIKLGLATNCQIREKSIFSRKHYFYPDLPQGYQVTQGDTPTCYQGWLDITCGKQTKRIGITRIHIEEDAGKSIHPEGERYSLLDLNRAGASLLEVVSEPDIRSPEEAGAYLRTLHQLVKFINVCNGNMEEGHFRCDANVSVMRSTDKEFGVRVEVKNLNSFRHVEKAIAYEIVRHREAIEEGKTLVQETRLWNEEEGVTKPMRSKEYAADYRYFPDPDLPPLVIDKAWIAEVKKTMPELPHEVKERFISEYKLDAYNAELLTADRFIADYFDKAVTAHYNPVDISNWIITKLFGRFNKDGGSILDCPISPQNMAFLVKLIDDGVISGKIAQTVFDEMFESGKDPQSIVNDRGLQQISDEAEIQKVIDRILGENPGQLEEYKKGKVKMFGYFIGQAMKVSDGKVNPGVLNQLLKKTLDS